MAGYCWEKYFEHIKATSVDNGVLFIKVESATWKQELYMQKNEIINKINKKIGTKAIKEIRLV